MLDISEDLKNDPTLSNFKDVESLAKTVVHQQKVLGSRIPLPKTDEERNELYNKLGRPEDPSKYEVNIPNEMAEFMPKEDIEQFVNGQVPNTIDTSPLKSDTTEQSVNTASSGGTRVESIKGIKAAMAKQMVASVSTIPHFTFCDEIDLTELIALRSSLKEQYKQQGVKLTMMPFFIKALSLALKEFPVLNTKVNDECTELTYFEDHNIGMAVDSKIGLLVPNIKQCQSKSIVDVANAVTRLTEAAREGRVSPDDLKGGTISISNIGAIGGTIATPIINKPEVAIVALGKLQHLPRFDSKGNVVSKAIMQVSWSGDHRVIDGGTIARFNNLWKSYLEEPAKMMMAMS